MLRKCAWLGLVVLLIAGLAAADSKARIVRISYVEGTVEMDRGDGNGFIRAFANMPVIEGVRLWPHEDGRAEVEFEDGSTLRLAPNTIVTFDELALGGKGEKLTRIGVQQGILYANLKDHDKDDLSFSVGGADLKLRHSSRFRIDANKDSTAIAVFRGELEVVRGGQRLKVKKNETLALDVTDPDRYYLSKGIAEGAHDYWDREREEQVVAAETRRSAPRSVVVYGYDDLSPYGTWIEVASYGRVWRPFGVRVGWHPYAYGSWVWYPGFGYTWVSGHPWGWTPYRYGGWYYVNTYGWCWRPGPAVNITNINIYNAPPHYVAPRPPVVTRGHPFTVVADINNQPRDPRSNWMPQPNRPTPTVNRGMITNEDLASGRLQDKLNPPNVDRPAAQIVSRPQPGVNAGITTKTTVDRSGRIKTADRDYDAVDYRRDTMPMVTRGASPATMQPRTPSAAPAPTVAERDHIDRHIDRIDRTDRLPSYKRDTIDREGMAPVNRPGPPAQSAPAQVSRPDPSPAPRIERAPSVPVYRPEPRPEPRVSRPAPTPSAPPSVARPAPAPAAPRVERPAPRINNASGKGINRDRD